MRRPVPYTQRDELFELYSELHLPCGRAAAALRLADRWDAPEDELLAWFEREEHRAEAIWKRIMALRDSMNLEPRGAPMNVIEVFLPLDTGHGEPIPPETIEGLVAGLSDRFGGATAYTREPAMGLWKRATTIERDRIIVVEVMVEQFDEQWWRDYRQRLEREFSQERVLIRATACRTI